MFIELLIFVHTDGYFVFWEGRGGGVAARQRNRAIIFLCFWFTQLTSLRTRWAWLVHSGTTFGRRWGSWCLTLTVIPLQRANGCLSLLERHGMIVADSQPQRWKLEEARDKVKVIGLFYSSYLPWPFLQHVSCVLCVYI